MGSSLFRRARTRSLGAYGLLLGAAMCAGTGGCSGRAEADQPHERVGQAIQPIIDGTASGAEHDAVVVLAQFHEGARRGLCSATLVAPNLLLTARHCVSDTDAIAACFMDGTAVAGAGLHGDRAAEEMVVFVGKAGVPPDLTVESGAAARGKKLVVDDATTICNRDLAFLVLDREIDAPVAQIRLGGAAADETVAAIGWGIDETGALPSSRRARPGIPLVGSGPMLYPDDARYGIGDAEFMVGESACAGDSGSPALAKSGAVVGVASRVGNGKPRDPQNLAATCTGETTRAVYTHLGVATALVAKAFAEAGQKIWLEGEPDPRAPVDAGAPEASPEPPPAPSGPSVAKSAPVSQPEAAPADASEGGGGCSASGEPVKGAVEQAAGLVALIALVVGLRRRFARRDPDAPRERVHRERLPSLP